ncbi:Kalirin [Dissostichus eleginoides]|uniref:Kalirin n=1 Tax=Dissostichus eleginoides TaxID=100907 RepID=A0AAD9BZ43_DISEL|nr:Kalirin [Dissostichus eleginoides]
MARGRQSRMDLGTSFRLDALICSQSCPALPTGLSRPAGRGVPGAEEPCLSSSHHSSLYPLTSIKPVMLIK